MILLDSAGRPLGTLAVSGPSRSGNGHGAIITATSLSLPFADGTFHAALGSPPYWGGLRVYSGPQVRPWPAITYCPMPGLPPVEIPAQAVPLGHESDPFAFVGHLLQVYREVRRTLRPEGVLAVNLGDCYSGSSMSGGTEKSTLQGTQQPMIPNSGRKPFAGLGRTWEAARETGRRFAGSDLSLEYCRIARSRSVLAAAERRRAAEAKRVRTVRGPLFDEVPRTPSPGA